MRVALIALMMTAPLSLSAIACEPSYRRNVSTILRDGQDGYWHHASEEWSAVISRYVRR